MRYYQAEREPPIPLRADRTALARDALTALARAAIITVRPQAKRGWSNDRAIELFTRSAVLPATMASAPSLIHTVYHLVASLVPTSASAALISRSLQLSFGRAGTVNVPSLQLATSGFVAERAAIPVIDGVSAAGATLTPFTFKRIVALTNEMIDSGNSEAFVKQVLVEYLSTALDASMLSSTAATPGLRPAGLFYNISPLTPTTAGASALVKDLTQLAGAIKTTAGAGQPILIAALPQAIAINAGVIEHWPVFASAQLADGFIAAVVPEAVATIVEPPQITSADAASLQFDDSVPSEDMSTGAPNKSLWQSNATAFRLIMPVSWGVRSPNAIAYISAANWP
jgi:hypothetical protein